MQVPHCLFWFYRRRVRPRVPSTASPKAASKNESLQSSLSDLSGASPAKIHTGKFIYMYLCVCRKRETELDIDYDLKLKMDVASGF